MPPRLPHFYDWLTLFALAVLWGSAFLFNELALRSFTPATIVATRVSIAAVVLALAVALAGGGRAPRRDGWGHLIVLAMLGTVVPFTLVAWAQQYIDSGVTGILLAVLPLFVYALAHFFVPGERFTLARAAGFVVGFAGVLWLIGPRVESIGHGSRELIGMVAVLGAALSFAANAVYARRKALHDPMTVAAGVMIIAALTMLPFGLRDLAELKTSPQLLAVVALIFLGLMSTGAASVLYYRIIQGPGPSFLSQVNYLIPIVAVIAGIVVLNERADARLLVGLALVFAGVAIGEFGGRLTLRLWHKAPRPASAGESP